jgi:hypothetical protein
MDVLRLKDFPYLLPQPTSGGKRSLHDQRMQVADFDRAPFTIAGSPACAFKCVHCR